MKPLARSTSIAARMGRWSATHRKTAIFGWLGFVLACTFLGSVLTTHQLKATDSGSGESGHVQSVLNKHFKQPVEDVVLVHSATIGNSDARFRAAVGDIVRTVRGVASVASVRSPFDAARAAEVSKDGHSVRVTIDLRTTDEDKATKLDAPVQKTLHQLSARHPQFSIEEFGVNAVDEVNDAVNQDFGNAGLASLPVTLVVLLIALGGLIAAGLPLLLALTAVVATTGLLALPSQIMPLDPSVNVIVLLIGLAVGVDYAMFYLKREREERAAGRSAEAALEAAAATSGRAVLASGITVMVAMAGMLFTGDKTFMGFGVATMMVVATAVVGSLTVLPATLSALGDRVEKFRVPVVHRLRRRPKRNGGAWSAILDRVLRRPVISALLAGGVLLGLGAPALQLHIADPGLDALPQNLTAVHTWDKLQKAFPDNSNTAQVMVHADDVRTPSVRAAISDLERRALATSDFRGPVSVGISPDHQVALVTIQMRGKDVDAPAIAALHVLRGTIVPASVGKLPGADVGVTGTTAQQNDGNAQIAAAAPYVFGFVLILAFVLMLLTFRSVVIAIKAVVLNLLSVVAAYGALVLVFQDGWGKSLLGFSATSGIIGWLPVFLFVILFGLSMDYHVFIVSRIREAYDRGMSNDDAVAHGIKSTAGVVTSAATVMVCVFAVFASLHFMFLKQFGVGLAVAVLVDATVVRAVLLPASMKLLGDWNWYLPRWLQWLPNVSHVEPEVAEAELPETRLEFVDA